MRVDWDFGSEERMDAVRVKQPQLTGVLLLRRLQDAADDQPAGDVIVLLFKLNAVSEISAISSEDIHQVDDCVGVFD